MPAARRWVAPDVAGPTGNLLLDLAGAASRDRMLEASERVTLPPRRVVCRPDEPSPSVHFPVSGVLSTLIQPEHGQAVETASVGNEGMVPVGAVLSPEPPHALGIAQVGGETICVPIDRVREEFERPGRFQDIVLRHVHAVLMHTAQSALCNRIHSTEQRCARWLLKAADRVGEDSFELTQEFLAEMVGTSRPAVTAAASDLQRLDLIRYHRGRLWIQDREGLAGVSCECYERVRRTFQRLLGSVRSEERAPA